jgi:hypothetical protein
MNADHNPRGGLTVDRDSLHASPEYARQVEALKQLQERKVNADVEKAVDVAGLKDPANVHEMMLRDYFAAKAFHVCYAEYFAGLARNEYACDPGWRDGVAIDSYRMADALLAARQAA